MKTSLSKRKSEGLTSDEDEESKDASKKKQKTKKAEDEVEDVEDKKVKEEKRKSKPKKVDSDEENDKEVSVKKKAKPEKQANASLKSAKSEEAESPQSNDGKTGFDLGYTPEKIIGAMDQNGELLFLIQWKNRNKAQLVASKLARKNCPQLVIDFYESRLTWQGDEPK